MSTYSIDQVFRMLVDAYNPTRMSCRVDNKGRVWLLERIPFSAVSESSEPPHSLLRDFPGWDIYPANTAYQGRIATACPPEFVWPDGYPGDPHGVPFASMLPSFEVIPPEPELDWYYRTLIGQEVTHENSPILATLKRQAWLVCSPYDGRRFHTNNLVAALLMYGMMTPRDGDSARVYCLPGGLGHEGSIYRCEPSYCTPDEL